MILILAEDLPKHCGDTRQGTVSAVRKVHTAKKGKSIKYLPPSPVRECHPHVVPDAHILLVMPDGVDIAKLPVDYVKTIAQARTDVCVHCRTVGMDCYQTTRPTWGCLECSLNVIDDCSWVTSKHYH